MLRLLLLALTAVTALGQTEFSMDEYCSLRPASWRGLYYNYTKPFVVTVVAEPEDLCYYGGMTFEAVNDITTQTYTDFILQANVDNMYDMNAVGSFMSHEEFPEVETESCDDGEQNVIMSSESGMYYAHKVLWTAPYNKDVDIVFNATFIDSNRRMYWTQTSKYPIEYSYACEPEEPFPSTANIPQCTSLMMILLAAMLNVYMVM